MSILRDIASMLSATTGTGTLTLTTAASGFITFDNAGVPHGGVTVTYLIVDGTAREVGRGVYTFSGLTLTRATVLASTNSGSKISCSGGQNVFIVDAAEDHLWLDEAQVPALTAAQKAQLFSNIGGSLYGGMLTPPVLANFTQFGSGATFTQNANANSVSILAATTNGSVSLKGMRIAAPATPYRAQALIRPQLIFDGFGGSSKNRCSVGFTDGTKLHLILLDVNSIPEFDIFSYASVTDASFTVDASANTLIGHIPSTVWMAVADDGSTVYFEYSYDGVNWVTIKSYLKSSMGAFLGVSGYTNVCVCIDTYFNSTAFTAGLVLLSWNIVASAP